ncbi:MAG: cupin domain-containing protein [Elusimicrobia bacterium]|nr:cupin domain-containing protein [Elusimicrobiota bacterium]
MDRLERIATRKLGPVRLKAVSQFGQLPGAAVFHVTVPPRSRHDMIFHRRTREWFMVVKGRGRGVIGRRRVKFRPGVIVFMPPGVPHQMITDASAMEAVVIFSPPLKLSGRGMDVHRA